MAKILLSLSNDEVMKQIPFSMICSTRYGSAWETMHRKRKWLSEFTESERKSASRLFRLSHMWYLKTGVPEEVTMSLDTYALWQRLAVFCASL